MIDPIETRLLDLEDAIVTAWKRSDSDSVLGELAALAAAVRQFYQEQTKAKEVPQRPDERVQAAQRAQETHWSHTWKRQHDS